MKTLNFRITGVAPLIPHNGLLADPLYEGTILISKISQKRPKTEADLEEMARLEFLYSLYLKDGEPCIPGVVLEAALTGRGGGARKMKKGKQAAAGLFVLENFPLEYEGPRDPKELWKDERFRLRVAVKVQQNKVMRTRPIFDEWAANVELMYNPDLVDKAEIIQWMEVAGFEVGLMDWRPKYGRFESELLG